MFIKKIFQVIISMVMVCMVTAQNQQQSPMQEDEMFFLQGKTKAALTFLIFVFSDRETKLPGPAGLQCLLARGVWILLPG